MSSIKKPNILFIVIDALRTRNLGCYGYCYDTSPNIDNLAEEGVVFEEAYSCTNATDPSLLTIFSGRAPLSHGVLSHGPRVSDEEIHTLRNSGAVPLPEILRSDGYVTLGVDWLGRFHRRGYDHYGESSRKAWQVYDLRRLWHRFLHKVKLLPDSWQLHVNSAEYLTNQAVSLIRNAQSPFFLFIHYWATHTPYNSPEGFYERYRRLTYEENTNISQVLEGINNSEWRKYIERWTAGFRSVSNVLAKYDSAIAYVDQQIGRLIKLLAKVSILDETLIVITSDHGESLTEHGIYFDHHGLYDESIRVPLILRFPEIVPRGKRITELTQHFDLVPSILEMLGVNHNYHFDGKSFIPLVHGAAKQLHSAVYAEESLAQRKRAIRTPNYKYIYALSEKDSICRYCGKVHVGLEELYDLTEDPKECRNIVFEKPSVANELRTKLEDWTHDLIKVNKRIMSRIFGTSFYKCTSKVEEQKIRERLRDLGYF